QVGLVLAALSIILVPFVRDLALVLVSIAAGIGVGTVWTNTDTLMSKLAEAGKLGATMGVAGSFKELGGMVGPPLIGLLAQAFGLTAQAFGLTAGFVICGVLGLLSLILIARPSAVARP